MRIIVLGAGGMLGHKLWQGLSLRFPDTYATIHGSKIDYERFGLFQSDNLVDDVDVLDFSMLDGVMRELHPNVVLNCIGVTKRREDSGDIIPSRMLNALFPHQLAQWGLNNSARVINFSTDCVFDGEQGDYSENSPTTARDMYGKTKAQGEISGENALTLRSSFIGRELAGKTELLEWLIAQKGKTVRGFRQALYTGVSTIHLAGVVGDIIERFPNLSGLYQLAGPLITKYDLLVLARDKFALDVLIEPDDSFICRRNLNGEKFQQATGYSPPSWDMMMSELASDTTPYT